MAGQDEPLSGWRTLGHQAALQASRRMISGAMPHALMLAGPPGVGKTTLALDIAAALLCTAPVVASRPCRECRACRLVEGGNHPDLHRVAPQGAGRQITVEMVRRLLSELALLSAEGGARVAVVEAAHRMNEDAQNAVLKTLEEPPPGVAIIISTDEEDRLLPTIRSRCARLRLGPVAVRDIEDLLAGRGLADPPTAARLARIAAGRSGLAVAYARNPEAIVVRGEIARTLLDLIGERPARRFAIIRDLALRGGALVAALDPVAPVAAAPARRGARRGAAVVASSAGAGPVPDAAVDTIETPSPDTASRETASPEDADTSGKAAPLERRRAALMLLDVWRDVARDLALVSAGSRSSLRDPALFEDLDRSARGIPVTQLREFLGRIDRTAFIIDGNANPELALDDLVLAWPHRAEAA